MQRVAAASLAGLRQGVARTVTLLGREAASRPVFGRVAVASAGFIGRRDHRVIGGYAAGYRIRLDHASKLGFLLGSSEKAVQAVVASVLSEGMVFYDLGANIGFLSLVGARLVGPSGQVVAFEPAPRNAATLRRNVKINRLSWVEIVEAAVSDKTGTAFFADGHSDQTGHLVPDETGNAPVNVVSLDAWLACGKRPPNLLKIDVEGAEQAVLNGARRSIREHRPVIICEIHEVGPRMADNEVCRFLRANHYSTEWLEAGVENSGTYWAPHLVARPLR